MRQLSRASLYVHAASSSSSRLMHCESIEMSEQSSDDRCRRYTPGPTLHMDRPNAGAQSAARRWPKKSARRPSINEAAGKSDIHIESG